MHLETIDLAALGAIRGGLARASTSSTNALLMQQMSLISDSIRDAARQQNQISPMMVAVLGMALMNR